MAQSWVVTKKKGKCTMDETYYNQLKEKADRYDEIQEEVTRLNNELTKVQGDLKVERAKANSQSVIHSFTDSASYAIGRDLAETWDQQHLGINYEVCGRSMIDYARGRNTWNREMMNPILMRFQQNFEENQRGSMQANIQEGAEFLARNGKEPGIVTTKSGLQYRVDRKGTGKRPKATDNVKVHYTGTLLNGTKFDSSYDRNEPLVFPLSQVIPGWTEGVQLMNEGSKYTFYIPYNLAYGEQEAGPIPPGSTLIFEIELIEVNPK